MILHRTLAVVTASATPSPTGSAIPGLSEGDISPGFIGFLVTFALAFAVIALGVALNRRVRRLNHAAGADHVVRANIDLGGPAPSPSAPPVGAPDSAAPSSASTDNARPSAQPDQN